MSDDEHQTEREHQERLERREAHRHDIFSAFLECELGQLSLDTETYNAHAKAIMDTFGEISGNDVLWVLGAVVGSTIADAPPETRHQMLIAFAALCAYSLERAVATKAAVRHHEEGHA